MKEKGEKGEGRMGGRRGRGEWEEGEGEEGIVRMEGGNRGETEKQGSG